jgi:hypothetical protein
MRTVERENAGRSGFVTPSPAACSPWVPDGAPASDVTLPAARLGALLDACDALRSSCACRYGERCGRCDRVARVKDLAAAVRADRCTATSHRGPLLDTAAYDAAGGMWAGMGTCAACGSTVHRDSLRAGGRHD